MTLKTRLSVLLISTPVLAFVLVGGLLGKENGTSDQTFQHLRVFEDVVGLVISNYVEDVNVDRVMEGAMRGLADGLDPDSAYLTSKQLHALEAGEALPDGDVGLELTRQYYLRVIAARGLRITNRYSPGYCDWRVSEQQSLFRLLPHLLLLRRNGAGISRRERGHQVSQLGQLPVQGAR